MPFLSLPQDPSVLRFADGEVTFHYLLSTPSCQTFVHAAANAATFDSTASGSTTSRHRKRLSAGSLGSRAARSRAGSLVQPNGKPYELELDPRFPILFFLPSESFSCAHLFADQLADADLAQRFNLVAIDPRGHGLTKDVPIRPDQPAYDLDIKAADIATFIQRLCNRALRRDLAAAPQWDAGVHLLGCSMSGLVAARIAARWPEIVTSVMFTSPILELESEFMIESFQGIKELIEETWHEVHHGDLAETPKESIKMPGEVVQGCTYRWAGDESIPHHISSYLNKTWVERLIVHKDGNKAAKDWWFDLYWLRQPLPKEAREAIRCEMLVVEGDSSLLYDRTVGADFETLFPNCKSFEHEVIESAPFLLSIARPEAMTASILRFLDRFVIEDANADVASETYLGPTVDEAIDAMHSDERFELIKVYAPNCLPSSDDEYDDSDDDNDYVSSLSGEEGSDAAYLRRDSSASFQATHMGDRYTPITITTVETFMSPDRAAGTEAKKQVSPVHHVSDLVQNLEINI